MEGNSERHDDDGDIDIVKSSFHLKSTMICDEVAAATGGTLKLEIIFLSIKYEKQGNRINPKNTQNVIELNILNHAEFSKFFESMSIEDASCGISQ